MSIESYLSESDAPLLKETKKDVIMGDPRSLVIIGLDTEDGPEHSLYDPRIKLPLVEETVRNIKLYGVSLPVLVIREKLDDGGSRLLVIDGRQRVRSAREANRRLHEEGQPMALIPYQVKLMGKEAEGKILLSLALNAHRQDDDIVTLCEKALHAVVKGVSKLSVCNAMKITAGTLERYTSVASECIPSVKNALREGLIGIGQAATLAKLSDGKQASALKEMLSAKAPVVESGDDGGNESNEGNESSEAASTPRPERVKKEREGVSVVELRKGLSGSAADTLPLGIFVALNWVAGNRSFEVAEEDKEAVGAALELLDGFLEKARIEAAQPKKRGRKPKVVAVEETVASNEAAATGEIEASTDAASNDEDFSGHVDPRLSDPNFNWEEGNDGDALDGGPDWSTQFDADNADNAGADEDDGSENDDAA